MTVQKRSDFQTLIEDLRRRVAVLETATTLRSSSIGSGGLKLRDGGDISVEYPGGNLLAILGSTPIPSQGEHGGFFLYDQDGQIRGVFAVDNDTDSPNYGRSSLVLGEWLDPAVGVNLFADLILFDADQITMNSPIVLFDPSATTADTANANINATTGKLTRSTSSLKYKTDVSEVEPMAVDEVLDLKVVSFRDKKEAEEDPEHPHTYIGLIAEDIDEKAPSLRGFLGYLEDEDGNPIPDSISYDRLWLSLLPVVKQQQAQIDALTKKVDELAARLASHSHTQVG